MSAEPQEPTVGQKRGRDSADDEPAAKLATTSESDDESAVELTPEMSLLVAEYSSVARKQKNLIENGEYYRERSKLIVAKDELLAAVAQSELQKLRATLESARSTAVLLSSFVRGADFRAPAIRAASLIDELDDLAPLPDQKEREAAEERMRERALLAKNATLDAIENSDGLYELETTEACNELVVTQGQLFALINGEDADKALLAANQKAADKRQAARQFLLGRLMQRKKFPELALLCKDVDKLTDAVSQDLAGLDEHFQ